MPSIRTLAAVATIALAAVLAPAAAIAQEFPNKPVRMLIGYPPGGPTDLVGRMIADHLSRAMGQPFVVENKPGAAGNVAGAQAAAAPADGYTLNLVGLAIMTVNHDLYGNMTFDPSKAFTPLSMLIRLPVVLITHTKTGVTNYKDFVTYARANSGKLNNGSPGIGTLPHLAGELFRVRLGFDSVHIPYRGTGPFAQGMMQAEMQWSFDVPNTALQLRSAGHAHVIGVSTAERHHAFPDVPTFKELGFDDMDWSVWFAMVVPVGTPKPIIDKLSAEIQRGLRVPENVERLKNAGLDAWPTTPEETQRVFDRDRATWSKVVRENKLKAE